MIPQIQPKDGGLTTTPIWAKLIAFDGVQFYSWVEQLLTPLGPIDKPGGAFGTVLENPAFEVNGILVGPGTILVIYRAYFDEVVNWTWGFNVTPGPIGVGGGSHLALARTDITAMVGSTYGTGSIEYYTSVLGVATATGIVVSCLNPCDLIPSGNFVEAFRDPISNIDFVENLCTFTPTDTAWYCLEDPLDTDCCAAMVDIASFPFVWQTDWSYLAASTTTGTLDFDGFKWLYDGFGTDPVSGLDYELVIVMQCVDGIIDLGAVVYLYDGALVYSSVFAPTFVDCSPLCYQGIGGIVGAPGSSEYITVGTCASCTVTITPDSSNLAANASTITIAGTGFDGAVPGNNLVTFNLGAVGVCTASTTTSLTVTFSTSPTSTGELDAVVTVGLCTYGPTQVATVVLPGIVIIPVGTTTSAGAVVTSITVHNVSVQTGLLVVTLAVFDEGTPQSYFAAWGNDVMTQQEASGSVGEQVVIFSIPVTTRTAYVTILASGAGGIMEVACQNVLGLTDNLPDVARGGSSLTPAVPSTLVSATSSVADEAVIACFALRKSTAPSITWAGTPTFVTTGQDVSDVSGGDTIVLTVGGYVASATQTFQAALTASVDAFGGALVSFK